MVIHIIFLFTLLACISYLPDELKFLKKIYWLIGIVLVLTAGFRSADITNDYENYLNAYNETSFESRLEPTFTLIALCVKFLFNNSIFLFVIYALLGVGIKFIAIKKLTNLFLLSALLYLSNFFLLHEMTQIRAGIASGILLLCIKPLYDRNFKTFFFLVVIAVSFHYSSVIILPLWFINPFSLKRKFYLSILPFAYVFALKGLTIGILLEQVPLPQVQSLYSMYKMQIENGEGDVINLFNSLQLLRCIVLYFLVYYSSLIVSSNKYIFLLVKIYTIALTSFVLFSDIPVISFRISELLSIVEIVLFPLIVYVFKEKRMAMLMPITIGLFVLLVNVFYIKLIF